MFNKEKAFVKFKPLNKKERTCYFDVENYINDPLVDFIVIAVKKNNSEYERLEIKKLDIIDINFIDDDEDKKEEQYVNPLAGW